MTATLELPRASTAPRPLAVPACPRYRALDFWRGVACLLVIVYHATMVHGIAQAQTAGAATASSPGGLGSWLMSLTHYMNVGVPLFFVISGYCISAAADSVRHGRHALPTYFLRRYRRIYPAYWIFLAAYTVAFVGIDCLLFPRLVTSLPANLLRPWWYSPWQWLGNLTLTETWRHYLIGNGEGHFPGHNWTLCYEEQFYLVTGLLLLCSRRFFFVGAVGVTVATLAIMTQARVHDLAIKGWFFDGYWLTFAAGVAVYYRVNYAPRAVAVLLDALLLGAAVCALTGALALQSGSTAAFAFAWGLALLHRWDSVLEGALLAAPISFCGRMCYSLYLVHQLPTRALSTGFYRLGLTGEWATLLVTVPCCVAVSVALSWVFFRLVERHYLNPAAAGGRAPA
jgi:peptidoglycan/LPS O-acetylase OafA/YrhL